MEKVRIGTISCGDIAINKHLPAQSKNPDAELVAFCDIVKENGAVINLRASWALNTTHVHEACAMFCGDKAGAEIMDSYSNKIGLNGF